MFVEHDSSSSVCSEISSACSGMFCVTSQSSESEDEQNSGEPRTKRLRKEKVEQAEISTSKEQDAVSSPVHSKYSGRGTKPRGTRGRGTGGRGTRGRGTRGRGTRGRGTKSKNVEKNPPNEKGKGSATNRTPRKKDESEDWLVF